MKAASTTAGTRGLQPHVLLLKQTAPLETWFVDLGVDLAKVTGQCTAYIGGVETQRLGGLLIVGGPDYRRDSDRARLWTWLRYFVGALWLALRTHRRTLLFIVAQPPYLPVIGYLKSLLFRQRYVVWVDDVYPDLLTRFGRMSERGPVVWLWRWLNRRTFGRASAVFTLGPCMADLVQRYSPHPVRIVPTWVDANEFPAVAKRDNPFAQEHSQVGKLTVLYSGNIGLTHDLDTMLEAARRLVERREIAFMVIGSGPRYQEVQEAAKGLENVTVLPLQPEEMLPYSLATGDVAVVSLGRGFEGISMPSKTYYAMAARSAVLGLSRPPNDLASVIDETGAGVNVEPGDVEGFVAAVTRFSDDPAYLESCRKNARAAAETRFSRETNVALVLDAIRPLLDEGGHG